MRLYITPHTDSGRIFIHLSGEVDPFAVLIGDQDKGVEIVNQINNEINKSSFPAPTVNIPVGLRVESSKESSK